MKKILIALTSVALIAGASVANAAELKMGFVNRDRILAEAAPAKRAQTKLEKEFASKDADLQKLAKQAKDLQTIIEKESVTMPDADRAKKERELANLNRDFQRAQREFREDLNLRRNEELAAVLERVNRVINQIADQEKFDLILQEAVYVSPRLDITDKVLKALADK
ncbi:MAG: OmpH family outer membrane protein [Pseudomonadota bacterium]